MNAHRQAAALVAEFHRCPSNHLVILSTRGDDKALCKCGKSNPACPSELPGVHVKRFLKPATVEEYVLQEEVRCSSLKTTGAENGN